MRAAVCTALTGISAVSVTDIAEPVAADGDAVVAVTRTALNHSDVLRTLGTYQDKAPLPFSPGGEIVGVIVRAPADCGFKVGQRVLAYVGHGGAREWTTVDPSQLIAIPDGVDDDTAVGLPITYGTALHALRACPAVKPGAVVGVLGAGGGAGLAAVEIATLLGARVVAVASRDKHNVCLDHGAVSAIDRDEPDLKQALRDAARASGSADGGPSVIYDCVGGAVAEPAFRSLRSGGAYLVIGFASRTVPVLPLNLALVKALTITGINWPAAVAADPDTHRADMTYALQAVVAGRLRPRVHGLWPLDKIGEALAVLDRGRATGKIIITI